MLPCVSRWFYSLLVGPVPVTTNFVLLSGCLAVLSYILLSGVLSFRLPDRAFPGVSTCFTDEFVVSSPPSGTACGAQLTLCIDIVSLGSVLIDDESICSDLHYVICNRRQMMQLVVAGSRHAIGSWRACCQGRCVYEVPFVEGELKLDQNPCVVFPFSFCLHSSRSRVYLLPQCIDFMLQLESNAS